jgi:hypothetical protein
MFTFFIITSNHHCKYAITPFLDSLVFGLGSSREERIFFSFAFIAGWDGMMTDAIAGLAWFACGLMR